jgi:ferrous iron transport protein B
LLIGTFFATAGAFAQAGIMLALYALGIVAAAGTAWLFKRSLLRGPTPAFILELPTYKVPQATQVARQVFNNTWSFLAKAGTTIFCLSIILWAMTYYPRMSPSAVAATTAQAKTTFAQDYAAQPHDQQTLSPEEYTKAEGEAVDKVVGANQIRYSVAGRIGHAMEPALKPLGYDWKMGVGLVGAFAAREVFVSTMGIVYNIENAEEETKPLLDSMREEKRSDGRPVFTPLVCIGLMVFYVLAMQCLSTVAIVRRETNSWSWPLFQIAYMTVLAWVGAFIVYQGGRLLGFQ